MESRHARLGFAGSESTLRVGEGDCAPGGADAPQNEDAASKAATNAATADDADLGDRATFITEVYRRCTGLGLIKP